MRANRCRIAMAALFCLFATLAPQVAIGGPRVARTFEQLQPDLAIGDKLTIVDRAGSRTVGKLTQMSPTEVTVETREGLRTFAASDVARIDCRRRGPVWNGALIGALSVGVPSTVLVLAAGDCGGEASACAGAVLMMSGMAAGVGALIDVAIAGDVKVFEAEPSTARSIAIAPILQPSRKGVLVTVGF